MRQAQERSLPNLSTEAILDILETIIIYKFPNLTRQEVTAMFAISDLRKTKVFEEVYTEGRQEGRQEGLAEGRQEGRQEALALERALVVRLLRRKVGDALPTVALERVEQLSLGQVEELGEALLEFEGLADLEAWLGQLSGQVHGVVERLNRALGMVLELSMVDRIGKLTLIQLSLLAEAADTLTTIDGLTDWLKTQSGRALD